MTTTFEELVNNIINAINYLIIIVIAVAFLYFIYGVFIYITKFGNEDKRKEAIQVMINGIIGLTFMLVIFSVVSLVSNIVAEDVGIPQF